MGNVIDTPWTMYESKTQEFIPLTPSDRTFASVVRMVKLGCQTQKVQEKITGQKVQVRTYDWVTLGFKGQTSPPPPLTTTTKQKSIKI